MHPRILLTAALLALAVACTTSHAAAQTDGAADVDARVLFDEGRVAYDEGRFDDAVRAFRRAYVLSPRYQLLYNVGQAELRAGHDDRALEAFEGFLRQAPADAQHRSEVQERVTVLRGMGVTPTASAEAPQPAVTTTVVEEPVAEPAPPASGGDATPWIVVGVGGALVVAGAVMMGVGVSEAQRVTDAPVGSRWVDLQGAADSANILWGVGIGAAALGLAAVGAGIAWALASSPGSESGTAGVTAIRVGLGSLSIEGVL